MADEILTTEAEPEVTPSPDPEPEVSQAEAEETATGEGQEADQYVSPFEGKEPDEVLKDPVVARLLADREAAKEAETTKALQSEAEQTAEREKWNKGIEAAQRTLAGQAFARVQGIIRANANGTNMRPTADGGEVDASPHWARQIAEDLASDAFMAEMEALSLVKGAFLKHHYPQHQNADLALATERAKHGTDPTAYFYAQLEEVRDAAFKAGQTAGAAATKKTADEAAKARAALEREREAERKPANGARGPTTGLSPSNRAASYASFREAGQLFTDGKISADEYRNARAAHQAEALPF